MKNIIIITLFCLSHIAFAQEKKKVSFFKKDKLSLTLSVANTKNIPLFNAIGVTNVFSNPLKPWYAIGIERTYKRTNKIRKYYGLELNIHDHKYVDKSIGLTLIGGFNAKIYKGIYAGLGMGVGFQKAKRADIVYVFENGKWEPTILNTKWRFNRPTINLNLEIGYTFNKSNLNLFLGSNIMGIFNTFGKDIPLAIYQTPIKIGIRKNL